MLGLCWHILPALSLVRRDGTGPVEPLWAPNSVWVPRSAAPLEKLLQQIPILLGTATRPSPTCLDAHTQAGDSGTHAQINLVLRAELQPLTNAQLSPHAAQGLNVLAWGMCCTSLEFPIVPKQNKAQKGTERSAQDSLRPVTGP